MNKTSRALVALLLVSSFILHPSSLLRALVALLLVSSFILHPSSLLRPLVALLLVSSFILHPSSLLRADGGAVRLSEQKGGYRITVFTSPTPLRAGPVDISVLIQEADSGEPASGVEVTIDVEHSGFPGETLHGRATTEAATNKLYHAATFDLPEPGWYSLDVSIEGPSGAAKVRCAVEAADPLPEWLTFWPLMCWPLLVVLLFGIHQFLAKRKAR